MSIYNSQVIAIDTAFTKETVSFILEQGALLGFRYRTWSCSIVDTKEATQYVLCVNEHGFNNIFVDYQDTDFNFIFTGDANPPLYISMNPPNFPWAVESAGFTWIDNPRYGLLLISLCKGLPIIDFGIRSDVNDDAPKPIDNNTIRVTGIFTSTSTLESKKYAEMLTHNISKHKYIIENNLNQTNITAILNKALQTGNSLPLILNCNNYKITLYFQEGILYVTALEPYALQVINNRVYIDIVFYATLALNIVNTFTVFTLSCNFNDGQDY